MLKILERSLQRKGKVVLPLDGAHGRDGRIDHQLGKEAKKGRRALGLKRKEG